MSCGELSFESPPFLHVTWKIPAFFQEGKYSGDSLLSPEFPFAKVYYCLELFLQIGYGDDDDYVYIQLSNLTGTVPGSDISYEIVLKSITGKEIDMDRRGTLWRPEFHILRSELEDKRDSYFPDGTLIVFCSVRQRKPLSYHGERFSEDERLDFRMIGELSFESPPFVDVTWKTPVHFKLLKQSGYSRESPEFLFCGSRYLLRLFPSSFQLHCVSIKLVNLTDTVAGANVSYETVLKSITGKEIDMRRTNTSSGPEFYISRSELKGQGHSPFPDGILTVFCSVRLREPSSAGRPKSSEAETLVFPGFQVSLPQVAIRSMSGGTETSDEEQEQEGLPGLAKLQSDYRQLLKKGAESDACLVVSGKEFRAHKNILRSRSPVFEAMFGQKTAEKSSGRVVIDDLDPESFGDFLEYLYTGGVEAGLSDDNAFGLYAAADKYDVPTLKSESLAHMLRNMSVDSFSDVVTLALRHQEEKLLKIAVTFFKENMAQIIVTVKWQQFVIDNGRSANELLIKAVVPGGQ